MLVKHVLGRLDPTDCTLLSRVAKPWLAVVVANNLPRAGKAGAVALKLRDFVGSVELLAWAKDNGCRWDAHTCALIAAGGRLEVLQWARDNYYCPWDERTCEAAAHRGHQDVAEWAWDNGCPWDAKVIRTWREGCPELCALWDEDTAVPAWQGVRFGAMGGAVRRVDAGRVVALDLPERRLTGDLPAVLGKLARLKLLSLNENQLTSVPAELGGLTALTRLELGGNKLTSVPEELGRLTALLGLKLHRNKLTSVPAALVGLTALRVLYINNNQLTSVPAELGELTALNSLHLDGNRLTSVPVALGELTALTARAYTRPLFSST